MKWQWDGISWDILFVPEDKWKYKNNEKYEMWLLIMWKFNKEKCRTLYLKWDTLRL